MINLLPGNQQKNIVYARRNAKMLRWLSVMVGSIVVMALLWGAGYFYLTSSISRYNQDIERKRADLKAQKLEETQARLEGLSNNLKLILQVLSKEVLFSRLFQQIGAVMPDGSILSAIEISKVEGGLDLSASAKDYDTATQIQVNLQDKDNKLFEKVDIISVSCGGDSTTDTTTTETTENSSETGSDTSTETTSATEDKYPCTVSLRALFNKDNPFLFINKSAGTN